ncbi:lysine exporter LysO family protein [Carboxylicivirga mesophila]|uniref:Lysine exporter LysO family protein n=1 Tax=Carboxylicivirga mesophila TaxID=1166478 RepID=A0ABS5KEF0_9BACT|nr:lysine exporter LysO family protein [Carboxylicivirga mesophila]MBS2212896.1 lysine exporter LysO family protein [Carboxylicivirga mesophila]
MKGTLITLLFFVGGCLISIYGLTPQALLENDLSTYALYALMALVGVSLGMDESSINILKKANLGLLLVPISIGVGSIIGSGLAYFLIAESFVEGMAVGAGFGYYSLSSVIISSTYDTILGVIALLSNISRELLSLVLAPLLVKAFGNMAPIASSGATSMDTTLPVITRYSGKEYAIIALFSGIVLTVLVPLLIPLIL